MTSRKKMIRANPVHDVNRQSPGDGDDAIQCAAVETIASTSSATTTTIVSDDDDSEDVVDEFSQDVEEEDGEKDLADDDDEEEEDDDSIQPPDEFICPLTLEIFNDPLMDKRGMNFERKAIVEWLNRGHNTCPLTREPLGYRSLIPNVNLRIRIENWKRQHGFKVESSILQSDSLVDDGEKERRYYLIEAPPRSDLEIRWEQVVEEALSAAIADGHNNSNSTLNERRRRRRQHDHRGQQQRHHSRQANATSTSPLSSPSVSPRTGFSPATQRRRLAGLLGDALSIVRRPPLASTEH